MSGGAELASAQAAYREAVLGLARVEERIDAVEQFADRAAEERADCAFAAAEARLAEAVERLHAAGGQTDEEIRRGSPPSARMAVRSQGDRFGLGESWEIVVVATGEHVNAFSSEAAAEAALAASDAKWERERERRERREASRG